MTKENKNQKRLEALLDFIVAYCDAQEMIKYLKEQETYWYDSYKKEREKNKGDKEEIE